MAGKDDNPKPSARRGELTEEDLQAIERYLGNRAGGDKDVALSQLLLQAAQYRSRINELEGQVADLEKNPVAGDDLKELEAFRALGKPDEIKKQLEDAAKRSEQLQQLTREQQTNAVAEVMGWKAGVLRELAKPVDGLTWEIDERTNDKGEKERSAYAVVDGKKTPAAEYAQSSWELFLPSLESGKVESKPEVRKRFIGQAPSTGEGPRKEADPDEVQSSQVRRIAGGGGLF